MHYFALGFVNIPEVREDKKTDIEIKKKLDKLEAKKQQGKGDIMTDFEIRKYSLVQTAFGRSVDAAASNIMYPYYREMEDPEYLEFDDQTEEFCKRYEEGADDFILLPNGSVRMLQGYPLFGMFVIKDGKVYETSKRTGGRMKRTKRAKRMKAMPGCPYKKAYKNFKKFTEKMYGASYNAETHGYGYYYNPDGIWSSCSLGGRWSHVLLVGESCTEYCAGKIGKFLMSELPEAPKGYKWASAARKKDIAWNAMREWRNQKEEESFRRHEKMFQEGKMEYGYGGKITPDGITRFGELYYHKDSTLNEFIAKNGIPKAWKYPINVNDIVDDSQWVSCEDSMDGFQEWHDYIDSRIDEADDDTVIAVLDYHN